MGIINRLWLLKVEFDIKIEVVWETELHILR